MDIGFLVRVFKPIILILNALKNSFIVYFAAFKVPVPELHGNLKFTAVAFIYTVNPCF